MNEFLTIVAASEGKRPTVSGVAYSGGKMRLFGWSRPVVVDMAGLAVPESVPLLANHENHTLGRVGVVVPRAVEGKLEISGEIVGEGALAEAIIAQGKAGADWQLSSERKSKPPNSFRKASAWSTVSNTMRRFITSQSQLCGRLA